MTRPPVVNLAYAPWSLTSKGLLWDEATIRMDDKNGPKPDAPKPRRPKAEDALPRAVECARKNDKPIRKFMVLPLDGGDAGTGYLVLADFKGGEIGVFVGAEDKENDAWFVGDKTVARDLSEFANNVWLRN